MKMPPKRRRKFHGLYFHSSPPKVLPMNGNIPNDGIKQGREDGFAVKPSNIRIWIHQRDIGNLTRVIWAGEGHRLRSQSTTNARVKKFLENVPYVMNTIKEIHQSVIDNKLEQLELLLDDPPPAIITTKDKNGLTVMHKAAGLGHIDIVEYLLRIWPQSATEIDCTGKTPLHWAASMRNNSRIYSTLLQGGAEEEVLDYKMKPASYYAKKPSEINRSLLSKVPDAPRVPTDAKPDWLLLVDNVGSLTGSVSKIYSGSGSRRGSDYMGNGPNLLTSRSRINSIENISEPEFFDGAEDNNVNEEPDVEDIVTNGNNIPNGDESLLEPPESPSQPEQSAPTPPVEETDDDTPETGEEAGDSPNETKKSDENSNKSNLRDELEINENNIENNEEPNNNDEDEELVNENKDDIENQNNNNKEMPDDHGDDVENNDDDDDDGRSEKHDMEVEKNSENDDETLDDNKSSEMNTEDDNESIKNNENDVENENFVIEGENKEETDNDEEKEDTEKIDVNEGEEINTTDIVENDLNDDGNKTDTEDVNKNDVKTDEMKMNENELNLSKEDENNKNQKNEINKNNNVADDDDDDQGIIHFDNDDDTVEDNHNSSPSPAMEIEGLVQGEPDNNQVQSQSSDMIDEESRVNAVIDSGDMEQLAQLVLNGDGNKIIHKKSDQPEIQAFLDNVPIYMSKIRRVHQAAREGNIRELQTALDRRKFAIAKDEISPNGTSPLHAAVVFGHAGILRYLAGRFPETTQAVDEDGRTPLHYAATLNDNGHFYNLLSQLGANPKSIDKLGNSPEFYLNQEQSNNILSHRQLLKTFGAKETLGEEMLSDQVDKRLDKPIFKTEQGQYLASSKWLNFLDLKKPLNLPSALGDPLIKGLSEIADKHPADPVAYLAKFLDSYLKHRDSTANNNIQNMNENKTPGAGDVPFDQMIVPTHIAARMNKQSAPIADDIKQIENTVESLPTPDEQNSTPKAEDRDEHGQSMLHFACARSHGRNSLLNLIEESQIDITYRDELYRTARDVSLQASQLGNAKEIDKYVIRLASNGDIDPFENMLISGYDHILDVTDDTNNDIFEVCNSRGNVELSKFLQEFHSFEEKREELHQAVREGNFEHVKDLTENGNKIVKAKNYYGRTALHIAILKENEDIVDYLSNISPETLYIGDNLERTPLHYAMGVNAVETISRILIRKGAKRTAKDLKGRQPSYYFMNKSDILRLQEEEEVDR